MKNRTSSLKSHTDIERLGKRQDHEIIIDDENPEWTPEMFAEAVVRRNFQPVPPKTLLSLRIDADVVEWFRAQGPGYQSRMNALLRAYMLECQRPRGSGRKASPR